MDGSQVVRWNGQSQSMPICTPVSINKLWGSSSNDLYAVGDYGNIAHWDGVKWRKIESGTTLNLKAISGSKNDLFVTGYSLNMAESILLKISNNNPNTIWFNDNTTGTEPFGKIIYSSKLIGNKLFVASNKGFYVSTPD
ncbi:MAG: hypothetical protein N3A67_09925, partial [Ignavibacteria bacterium]|nr:hypothetical protein [Ignavibacteria bacterium]